MELVSHKILAFGIARDIVGGSYFVLELPENSEVSDLRSALLDRFPSFGELLNFSIAINHEYVRDNIRLHQGDEIAIIPPVSGG